MPSRNKNRKRRKRRRLSQSRHHLDYFDAWGLAMVLHHMDDLREFSLKMCDLGSRDEQVPGDVIESRVLTRPTVFSPRKAWRLVDQLTFASRSTRTATSS